MVRGVSLLAAAMLVAAIAMPSQASGASVPARSAADFRDSIGLDTHIVYWDTAYGDLERIVPKLDELGVDHLRDNTYGNNQPQWRDWNERYYQRVESVATARRKFTFIMGEPHFGAGSMDELLGVVRGRLRHATEGLEGANEYDLFTGGPNWAPDLRAHHRELYRRAKADPLLRGLPVIAPSLVFDDSEERLGSLADSADFGNIHPYTGGQAPSRSHLDRELADASVVSGTRPVYATEVGFHNAMRADQGQLPVSEEVGASYLLRTYLEHFHAGIRRTYAYELIDEKPDPTMLYNEQHFGLLRNDYSEKPAFTALQALLRLIGRPTPVTPERLDLGLAGETGGVRQLLLQKAPGRYTLVLWQAASEWDTTLRRKLAVTERDVTVTLPAEATVSLARPAKTGGTLTPAGKRRQVTVAVPADPVLVELDLRTPKPVEPPVVKPPTTPPTTKPPTPNVVPCPRSRKGRGAIVRRAGAEARVRTRSSLRRPVRVQVCAPRSGKVVVQLGRATRGGGLRVLASRRVAVEAGRGVTVNIGLSRRARRSFGYGERPAVRVRYRPSGGGHTVVLQRRLSATALRMPQR